MLGTLLVLNAFIGHSNSYFTGFRYGDFPPSEFLKTITLSTRNGFAQVDHDFGQLPFYVRVYATLKTGKNAGFKFDGTGVCQNDGGDGEFGGVMFAYNEQSVRVWVPTEPKRSAVILVGSGWGGRDTSEVAREAEITIEAWREGPYPAYVTEKLVDSLNNRNFEKIYHQLRQLPEMISVRVFTKKSNYTFHGGGASQTASGVREYGGVLYSYNEQEVHLWTPNKPKSGCALINKKWGKGKYAFEMSSKECIVEVRLWVNAFPLPLFQTDWLSITDSLSRKSYYEFKHNLKMLPALVKVEYRLKNIAHAFVFRGSSSIQSTSSSDSDYGGIAYAYDKNTVRIWLPSGVKKGQSNIIYIANGWGNKKSDLSSKTAEMRVQVFVKRCFHRDHVVDGQGVCRDISESTIVQDMTEWGDCSNPCGNGTKERNIADCQGHSLQTTLSCEFETDLCDFNTSTWRRVQSIPGESNVKLPSARVNKGGYAMCSEYGNLVSPKLNGEKNCVLTFKYMTGKYAGTLYIDVMDSTGYGNSKYNHEAVWTMGEEVSLAKDVWLTGYVNFGDWAWDKDVIGDIYSFRFYRSPSTYTTNLTTACVTNLVLKCEKRDAKTMPPSECKHKGDVFSSCLFDAFKPFYRGPAWTITFPEKDKFVTARGNHNDVIARYKVHTLKSGAYKLWISAFAMNNQSNGMYVDVHNKSIVVETTFNANLWQPIPQDFTLETGIYTFTLRQKEKDFRYNKLMLVPIDIQVWSDLGMQNHHIPDNNFKSLNSPDQYLAYSRLHSKAGWLPTDMTDGGVYLEIRLPDITLVNKIATQGGSKLDTIHQNAVYCAVIGYRVKISIDGKNFAYYRNSKNGDVHIFEGNNNVPHMVRTHTFQYPLPLKALRVYPRKGSRRLCLRVELYGFPITTGMCPQLRLKTRKKECVGNMVCPVPGMKCQPHLMTNVSECSCADGRHGNTCQYYGCSPDPCQNGGRCAGVVDGDVKCNCASGFTGRVCQFICPKGKYGVDCIHECNCPVKEYCDRESGACLCEPGLRGPTCDQPCPKGTYGQQAWEKQNNCRQKCLCGNLLLCDAVDGACYCVEGSHGPDCSLPCSPGNYGRNCSQICICSNSLGVCSPVDGQCNCSLGYYGLQCEFTCAEGRWGENCVHYCENPPNSTCDKQTGEYKCFPGVMGKRCDQECSDTRYGRNCENTCKCNMINTESCDKKTGDCKCKLGFLGLTCSKTCNLQEKWGSDCKNNCLCKNWGTCALETGVCTCLAGYVGRHCETPCTKGMYGASCSKKCNCDKAQTARCDATSGICMCEPGFEGPQCMEQCREGTWGMNCQENCHCKHNATCDHRDGFCYCPPGYHDQYCSSPCPQGTYDDCQKPCQCKHGALCDNVDGSCTCSPGYRGDRCDVKCPSGRYSLHCAKNCSCVTAQTVECDNVDGYCVCKDGFVGDYCEKECKDGFFGENCLKECVRCRHTSTDVCNKPDGSCVCEAGFTGQRCLDNCPLGQFGRRCQQECSCGDMVCNIANGGCYNASSHVVDVKFRAPISLFEFAQNNQELRANFEQLMALCYDIFVTLSQNSTNITTTCSQAGGTEAYDNFDEFDSSFTAQILKMTPMYLADSTEISLISFTVLKNTTPLQARALQGTLDFVGLDGVTSQLAFEYYAGPATFHNAGPATFHKVWYRKYMLQIIISAVCLLLLIVCVACFVHRAARHKKYPASMERVKPPKEMELRPCFQANTVGHVYSFENPYYDVIAAMGLDDDVEEDYFNPLYMLDHHQLDQTDSEHHSYRTSDGYNSGGYLYDKDSGVSSVTLS